MPVETTTPNLLLTLPYAGETSWDSLVNGNFGILDQSAIKTLTALGNTTISSTGTYSQLLNLSGAGAVSVGVGAGSATISAPVATNFSLNGSSSSVSIVAGNNVTLSSSASTMTIGGAGSLSLIQAGNIVLSSTTLGSTTSVTISAPAQSNFSLNASTGSISFVAGTGIGLSQSASTITISSTQNTIRFTQNMPLAEVQPCLSAAGTVTANFVSSLFLNRICLPAPMKLSEVDLALAMSFNATSDGAGTMSQTFILYSFGNSTSLASLASVSSVFVWATGTSTVIGSVSLSQFQGGWSGSIIHPFTFASTSIASGEYVIGNNLAFAQLSSTWTVSMFGDVQGVVSSGSFAAMTAMTSASANLVQSVSGVTAAETAFSNAATFMSLGKVGSTASFITNTASLISVTATAASTVSFLLNAATAAMTHVSLINSTVSSVLTAAGPAALASTTISFNSTANHGFIFQGTGSTQSTMVPFIFANGVASVTATSTIGSIAVTNPVVSFVGSNAGFMPWYQLGGL